MASLGITTVGFQTASTNCRYYLSISTKVKPAAVGGIGAIGGVGVRIETASEQAASVWGRPSTMQVGVGAVGASSLCVASGDLPEISSKNQLPKRATGPPKARFKLLILTRLRAQNARAQCHVLRAGPPDFEDVARATFLVNVNRS